MERVGHSYISARMKKVRATFGCEHSSHYYYEKNYSVDSGIITSFIMCEIFSNALREGKKVSDVIGKFQKYAKSEEKSLKVIDKKKVIAKVERRYRGKAKKISKMQGVRMDFEDYWFSVRASNTEPLLRVNLEANDEKIMKRRLAELLKFIRG